MGRGTGTEVTPGVTPARRRINGGGAVGATINAANSAFHTVNNFLITRFGLDKRERLALAGTAAAAPLAALAGPVLGFGVAMGLVAPHLHRKFKEHKSAAQAGSEDAAAMQAREQLAPLMPEAQQQSLEAEARVAGAEAELQATINSAAELEQARQQQIEEEVGKRLALDEVRIELENKLEEANWENEQLRQQLAAKARPADEDRAARTPAAPEPAVQASHVAPVPVSAPAKAAPAPATMDGNFDYNAYMTDRRDNRDNAAHVLMPLAPHWAEHILRGDCKYEFRKGALNQLEKGSRVAIYTKAPIKAITGYFDVDDVIIGRPDEVWEKVKDDPEFGYGETEFFAHCKRAKKVTVAKIGSVRRLSEPADTDQLGFKPTDLQGVRYLHYQADERHDKILTLTEHEDARIAAANDGVVPVGAGSESPADLLAAAQASKAKEERRSGRSNSALASLTA